MAVAKSENENKKNFCKDMPDVVLHICQFAADTSLKCVKELSEDVAKMFEKLETDYTASDELMQGLKAVAHRFRPADNKMMKFVYTELQMAKILPNQLLVLKAALDNDNQEAVRKMLEKILDKSREVHKGFEDAHNEYADIAQEINEVTRQAKDLKNEAEANRSAASATAVGGTVATAAGGLGLGAGITAVCLCTGPIGWGVGLASIIASGLTTTGGVVAGVGGTVVAINESQVKANAEMIHNTLSKVNTLCGLQLQNLQGIDSTTKEIMDSLDAAVFTLREVWQHASSKSVVQAFFDQITANCAALKTQCEQYLTTQVEAQNKAARLLGLETQTHGFDFKTTEGEGSKNDEKKKAKKSLKDMLDEED